MILYLIEGTRGEGFAHVKVFTRVTKTAAKIFT